MTEADWFMEARTYVKVFATDESGRGVDGSLQALRYAITNGATVRVKYFRYGVEVIFSPVDVQLDQTSQHVSATYADLVNYQKNADHVIFHSNSWMFTVVSTHGTVHITQWKLSGETLASPTKETVCTEWFVSYSDSIPGNSTQQCSILYN